MGQIWYCLSSTFMEIGLNILLKLPYLESLNEISSFVFQEKLVKKMLKFCPLRFTFSSLKVMAEGGAQCKNSVC